MTKKFHEVILLVEADGLRLRGMEIRHPNLNVVVERCHISPTQIHERVWQWLDGERAATGQRVFRDAPKPAPPVEESENPTFDEMNVKIPLGVKGE